MIQQMVRDPLLLASYREWLSHPITKEMRKLADAFATPVGIRNVNGEEALYSLGHAVAASNLIRVLFDIEKVADEQAELAKMRIDPDYGMRKILAESKVGEET